MKRTFLLLIILFPFLAFAQNIQSDKKTISYFENFITVGNKPPDADVQSQYKNDWRLIVWNDPLIKDYKYSNEAFDKMGYQFVKNNINDEQHWSKIYRNCDKSIIVEVTEWYGIKLSIDMQWYSKETRNQIVFLMFCKNIEDNMPSQVQGQYKTQNISNEPKAFYIESEPSGSPGLNNKEYSLKGRIMLNKPSIIDSSLETGVITIRIKVDRNGKVISAAGPAQGSTTTSSHLVMLSRKAAMECLFDASPNFPEEQFGTLTFTFKIK